MSEPSVQALRTQAEANRARLTNTVEDLRTQVSDTATDLKERFSPSAIKAEVTDYVRDSRDHLRHSLEQKVRNNPLQAVAVGAAIAYPAFQLLRAMPAPLLLVGAGILLSRAAPDQRAALSEASGALSDRTQAAYDGTSEAVEGVVDKAREKFHDAQDAVRAGVDIAVSRATEVASSVKDKISGSAETVKGAASDSVDKVVTQAEGIAQQAGQSVRETWEQNPLMVAGVGLAIGAFIAAAFPATKVEESLFGDTSEALRRQAERAGVDAARTAVEGMTSAADSRGLSVEGLKQAGDTLTEKARVVAERGIDAVLGETKTNS